MPTDRNVVIYREPDRYCSFPHVVRLPSGPLAVVFRKASAFSADAARRGVATHHDPDSSIEMIVSTDEGETWDPGTVRTAYKSGWGVNDPALTVLADGTLALRFVALDIRPTARVTVPERPLFSHRSEHGLVTTVVGNLVLESGDEGRSWSEIGVADAPGLTGSCSRDPIVELADGSWLMPVYTGAPQRSDIAWVIRSFDRGRHWCEPIRIMSDDRGVHSQLHATNYNEASIVALGGGELLAMVRADTVFDTEGEFMPVGGVGEIVAARSRDSGLCWSPPQRTGIWGQPGSVIELASGDLLCTYGYRRSPFGVRAVISRDRGATWDTDHQIVVRDNCPTWDCGYPFSIELEPGRILSVYYFVDEDETRHVAGTHWRLP